MCGSNALIFQISDSRNLTLPGQWALNDICLFYPCPPFRFQPFSIRRKLIGVVRQKPQNVVFFFNKSNIIHFHNNRKIRDFPIIQTEQKTQRITNPGMGKKIEMNTDTHLLVTTWKSVGYRGESEVKYPVYIGISCLCPCDSLHRGGVAVLWLSNAASFNTPTSCLLHQLSLPYSSLESGYSIAHLLGLCIYNDVFRFFFLLFTL